MWKGNLIETGGQVRSWCTGLVMSFDKSRKFKVARNGNRGQDIDWNCRVLGKEVPGPALPKERLRFAQSTDCERLAMF